MNKKFLALIITRALQALAAWFFAFGTVMSMRVGGGLELIVFPAAAGFAIWAVGLGCEYLFFKKTRSPMDSLPLTLIGSALGAVVLLVPNVAWGFQGLMLPVIGGLGAYHFSGKQGGDD